MKKIVNIFKNINLRKNNNKSTSIILIISLVFCSLFFVGNSKAQTVVSNHFINPGSDYNPQGQSFVSPVTDILTKIKVLSDNDQSTTIQIYSGAGTSGTLLGSKTVNLTYHNSIFGNYSVLDLSSLGIILNASSTYTFYFPNSVSLIFCDQNGYIDGDYYNLDAAYPGYDMDFEVVIGYPIPKISYATYNYGTNVLNVTGENLVSQFGAANDIDVSKLSITGQGGITYQLTTTPDVEITSSTSFSVTLNATDKAQVNALLNKNGISSIGGTFYNLAAAADWCSSVLGAEDLTGNEINVNNVLILTKASQANVSCNSGSNGTASVNVATGGAGGYQYNWTPGNPTGDGTTSVSGLTAGTWTCTVTDANSNSTSQSFTIIEPTAINITNASRTDIACNGGSTGALSINVPTGGAGGYQYNWTPGNPTGDGTTSITGLTAGTWTCTVTDANGCTKDHSNTLTQPTAINLTALSQTNVSCNGGSNGAASVNVANGGAGGFQYNWTPGNPTGDGTTSITGLSQGIWTCTVTDNYGCTKAQSFTITEPTMLNLTAASQTNVSCNGGSNGAASVNVATGGAGGYQYNWTPGNPTGDGTTSVTGLTQGTWTCTVTDANGCTKAQSFTITQPIAVVVTAASQTNVSCNGGSNGAASVNTATGGAGGYQYNWTPGNPTGDGTTSVSGLTQGAWTCTVTDASGCTSSQSFNISQPTAINLTAASQTNVSCNGGSNGAASVNIPTGGAGGYQYNWTPGNPTGDGTTSVTGLTQGTWICTVTDAIGCTKTQSFNITQPTILNLTAASQTNVSCNGGSNGAASVNVPTGGAGGYQYNWTPGNPTGDGTTSVTGLTQGTWTCTVTDANGCTKAQSFTITEPTVLNLTAASQTNVSCNGGSNGAASVNTATGGAGGYQYNWTPGNPTGDGTTSVTGLTQGTWICTVTDANGCTKAQSFNITQPTAINLTALSQTNVSCNGGSNGAASVNVPTGGAGGYQYNWTPGNPSGDGTTSVTGLTQGTWTCSVTDAIGCTKAQSFTITEPTVLNLTAASQTNVSCNGGSNGAASVNVATGGAGGYQYNWTPGNPTGDGTNSVTGLTQGTWTCTVTDANGCTKAQSFTITEPTVLNLTASSQTNVSCNGGSNGAASVNIATGGAGGYQYNWTPGNPTGDGTTSISGLPQGTWICTVTDANGCTKAQSFNITQPTELTANVSQTNVSILGGNNGSATVEPNGGVLPYKYLWTPTGDTTATTSNLSAGDYSCLITDANLCNITKYFTISQPIAQNIDFAVIDAKTYGDNSFVVSATGGASGNPIVFSSSNELVATCTGVNGSTITILKAGDCQIHADQAGNTSYAPATRVSRTLFVNPKAITVTVSPNQTKIYGESDPVFNYSNNPSLISGDDFTGQLIRISGENVNSYLIQQGTLALDSNYILNFVADNFTITKKELTVTANDTSRNYGQVNPSLTYTINGFVVGENISMLDTLPTITCNANINALAGEYPIQLSGGFDNNYYYSFVNGSLTVNAILGTVTTSNVTEISSNSAVFNGEITSNGGDVNVQRGFVYGITPNPTLSNNQLSVGVGEGVFSEIVAGLSPNTLYYVRAYVTNEAGTDYGNEKEFTTLSTSISNIENASIMIYPNPFKDYIYLKNVDVDSKIEIYTMNGVLLQTVIVANPNEKLQLDNLALGIYMLKITTSNGTNHFKLNKQ